MVKPIWVKNIHARKKLSVQNCSFMSLLSWIVLHDGYQSSVSSWDSACCDDLIDDPTVFWTEKFLKFLKDDFDSVLDTVIHIVSFFFKSIVMCGDRTGSDSSHGCVIGVVLCPGSITQLHQRGTQTTEKQNRENNWNHVKSPQDEIQRRQTGCFSCVRHLVR